ncbi:MAG: response regulator transcription factor [Bacteroidales bacterium]|nr:response regulator transcription factor [Bacteroidales bacterium]
MKVLIIEDEPFAQKELIRLLRAGGRPVEVVATLDSVEDSVEWFASGNEADLVFMDIQLSDGLSFEIFSQTEVKPPVIFTTAYDEYALKAFKVNSIDYLLKPVDEEELRAALAKFDRIISSREKAVQYLSEVQLQEIIGLYRPAYKSRLVVRLGDKIRHIDAENIAYFFSEDKVTFLMTTEKKKYIMNYSLEQIESFMNPATFFRLNRKYIASIRAIEGIDKYFNSRLRIDLKPPVEEDVLVSRVKVNDFLNWLER